MLSVNTKNIRLPHSPSPPLVSATASPASSTQTHIGTQTLVLVLVRSATQQMANLLHEPSPDGMVGYLIRGVTAISSRTKGTVITNGVLLNMLRDDPDRGSGRVPRAGGRGWYGVGVVSEGADEFEAGFADCDHVGDAARRSYPQNKWNRDNKDSILQQVCGPKTTIHFTICSCVGYLNIYNSNIYLLLL